MPMQNPIVEVEAEDRPRKTLAEWLAMSDAVEIERSFQVVTSRMYRGNRFGINLVELTDNRYALANDEVIVHSDGSCSVTTYDQDGDFVEALIVTFLKLTPITP